MGIHISLWAQVIITDNSHGCHICMHPDYISNICDTCCSNTLLFYKYIDAVITFQQIHYYKNECVLGHYKYTRKVLLLT